MTRDRKMGTCAAALLLMLPLCSPKVDTTLDEPPPPVEEPDTSFVETEEMVPIDTSDEVSFREAALAEELERKVRETLTPIYFEFNSFSLTDEGFAHLEEIASFMNEYEQLRILVEGHCDERGSSEYNMGLGENRARVVKEYLVNYGLPAIRIEITSWGKERPVSVGCTDEACHSRNRRAEFKVLQR